MRLALLAVAGCWSAKPAAESTAPPLSHHARHTCQHAARGLAGATRGVRDPEADVYEGLVQRCDRDGWPAVAIDCFAEMAEGDLGRCAKHLDEREREAMFSVLAGSDPSTAGIVVARARLQQVSVGIEECDRFVGAVITVLGCDGLALDVRLQLGNETAQFWSLPTDRLAPDDIQHMAQVCDASLETLARETAPVGCVL